MGTMLFFITGYYIFRTIFTINSNYLDNFMDAGLVHSTAIILFAVWSVVISFGIFIVMSYTTQRDLEKDAYFDSLTGLFNKKAISDQLFQSQIINDSDYLGYILCDIDDFKEINDQYGHIVGDVVLYETAQIMKSLVRRSDFVSRFGGDEFFVFISSKTKDTIINVAEKIRKSISDYTYHHNDSVIKTSVSVGIHITNSKEEYSAALSKADQALYQAKDKGKNKIEYIIK